MPPKIRITKEEIIDAAVDIVRKDGMDAVNARTIAKSLNCSTQPVFSNFSTMEKLRAAVVKAAGLIYQEYVRRENATGRFPVYKAIGMAYIRFAKDERELFKLLYMRDRSKESVGEESQEERALFRVVQEGTGLSEDMVRLFHLEMWVFVHGIGTMIATGYLELEEELISEMLTDAYQGLKNRYEGRE